MHMDVKHLPKLRDGDGQTRKRYLYVAIDRASRDLHLAVKDNRPLLQLWSSSTRRSRPCRSGSRTC